MEEPLKQPILRYENNEKFAINLSPTVVSSIAEGDCLSKLMCDLPLPTKVILLKSSHFQSVCDRLDVSLKAKYKNCMIYE